MGSPAIFKGKLVKFLAKAGILVPSRGEADRTAEPAAGETAFNTDSNSLEVYNGSSWGSIGANSIQAVSPIPGAQFADTIFIGRNNKLGSPRYIQQDNDNVYVSSQYMYAAIAPDNLKNHNAFLIDGSNTDLTNIKMVFDDVVYDSFIFGTSAIIVGRFTSYNGVPAKGIVKISLSDGSIDTNFQQNVGSGFDADFFGSTEPAQVLCIAGYDQHIIVGGRFNRYNGQATNFIAKINRNTGELVSFPTFNSTVHSLAIYNNFLFAVGEFTIYNSQTHTRIVKIDLDTGLADPQFNSGTGFEQSIPIDVKIAFTPGGASLYVRSSNAFTRIYNGTSFPYVIKLNPDDASIDFTFLSGLGSGPDDYIQCMSPTANGLIVGGDFTSFNGVARNYLAMLNHTTGAVETSFLGTGTGPSSTVSHISRPSEFTTSDVYIMGEFTSYNGISAQRLAKINHTTGDLNTSFDTAAGLQNVGYSFLTFGKVIELVSSSNILVVGGIPQYKSQNPYILGNVFKISKSSGALDTSFNINILGLDYFGNPETIASIIIDNTSLFVGGYMSPTIRKFDTTTGAEDSVFSPSIFGVIYALAIDSPANHLYVAYSFANLARINTITGATDSFFETEFNGGFNNNVDAIAVDSTGVYCGGSFTTYSGVSRPRLAKLRLDGFLDSTFNTSTKGLNNRVRTIELGDNNSLYIGGQFTTYEGSSVRVCKISRTDASRDLTFNSVDSLYDEVYALEYVPSDNALFIGGRFTSYDLVTRKYLAKVNANTADLDLTFEPSIDAKTSFGVEAIISDNTNVYVGVVSTVYDDVFRCLLALNPVNANISAFPPSLDYTIQLSDNNSTLLSYEGGNRTFTIPANLPIGFRFRIAQLDSGTVTVAGGTGVTINSSDGSLVTTGQYNAIDIFSYEADKYIVTKG